MIIKQVILFSILLVFGSTLAHNFEQNFQNLNQEVPQYLDFHYNKYEQCRHYNEPLCNENDEKCLKAVDEIYQNSKDSKDCIQCELDKANKAGDGWMPVTCSRCASYQMTKEDDFPLIVTQYILPVRSECSQKGNVDLLIPKNISTIKYKNTCQQKCPTCQTEKCNQTKINKEYCIEQSIQCEMAQTQLNSAKSSSDYFPFSLIACSQSCKYELTSSNPEYLQIEQCEDDCNQDTDQFQGFSFQDYQKCLDQNLPKCSFWDANCKNFFNQLEKDQSLDYSCRKCTLDLDSPMGYFLMPKSCSLCNTNNLFEETPQQSLIKDIIVPVISQCSEKRKIDSLQEKISAIKISEYQTCATKCPKCPDNDISCKQTFQLYKQCLQESTQCQLAQKNFNQISEKDRETIDYPVYMVACQQSCKFIENKEFLDFFKCQDSCHKYEASIDPIPEPDHPIDVLDFNYQSFLLCMEQYVPQCAPYNEQCKKELRYLDSAVVEGSTKEICQKCEEEKDKLKKNHLTFKMPLSCSYCMNLNVVQLEEYKFGDFITKIYIPAQEQCSRYAKIVQPFIKVEAIKYDYNQCKDSICPTCKTDDQVCFDDEIKFQKCLSNSENLQCKTAIAKYELEDSKKSMPLSYFICMESCKIEGDQDSEFKALYDCQMNYCSQLVIYRKDFTYSQYGKCINQFEPVPINETARYLDNQLFLDCIEYQENDDNCKLCWHLGFTERDDQDYNFSSSCSQCFTQTCSNKKKKEDWDPYFYNYMLPVYLECSKTATFSYKNKEATLPFKIDATINSREDCYNQKCKNLPCDGKCKIIAEEYDKCQESSQQCLYAMDQFYKLKKDDFFPYDYEICRMGCIPKEAETTTKDEGAEQFNLYENCEQKCNRQSFNQIYLDIKTIDVNKCNQKYLPDCPSWDHECSVEKQKIQHCAQPKSENDTQFQQCSDCLKQKNQSNGFHPKSCLDCVQLCESDYKDSSQSKIITNHYLPNLLQCNQFADIKTKAITSVSTVNSSKNCLEAVCSNKKNCARASNISKCRNDEKAYIDCKISSKQCQLASNEWDIMNSNIEYYNQQLPYSKLICEEVCVPFNVDLDFKLGIECENFCYRSGYNPDRHPQPPKPTPDSDPIPDKDDKNKNQSLLLFSLINAVIAIIISF